MNYVTVFLTLEALVFGAAAMIHGGLLIPGYEHREATIAESVIALVLLAGLAAAAMSPRRSRAFGLAAQAFALLGTMVGIFTMVIGIGPQSVLDVMIHATMVALLVTGLIAVARVPRTAAG